MSVSHDYDLPHGACDLSLVQNFWICGKVLMPEVVRQLAEWATWLHSYFSVPTAWGPPPTSALWCLIMISIVPRTGGKGGKGVRRGQAWV